MKILAFDTSTSTCAVGLYNDGKISTFHQAAAMQQGRLILPAIQDLLAAEQLTVAALDAIALGCGPGSFTGIRIASSVAQGLAFPLAKPVITLSSMAILAQSAYLAHQCSDCLVAVDARMNRIYSAAYQLNANQVMELVGEEQLSSPQAIKLTEAILHHGVGDGWSLYQAELEQQFPSINSFYPTETPQAEAILTLACDKFKRKEWVSAAEALPVYLEAKNS